MNKAFRFGSLFVGLGLFIGCDGTTAPPQVDSASESPAYEQEMTGEGDAEVVVEESVEVTEEAAPEAPTPEAPAPEAPAPEAPAPEAPAPEAPAPEAPTAE